MSDTSPPSLDSLPPLPETDYRCLSDLQSGTMPVWTEHAMREYARAAIAAWNRRAAPGGADLQDEAYAEGRKDEQEELSCVLPGTTYMDPPDGGAPTILEQLQRMAKDARRYLWLRAGHKGCYDNVMIHAGRALDDAVDAAMAKEVGAQPPGVAAHITQGDGK